MKKHSTLNKSTSFIGALLSFYIGIFLTALPTDSHAQSGSRICVNEAGTYAAEIDKGRNQKYACKAGRVKSILGRWGKGRYMTCEAYARNYLKWDYSPCHEMDRKPLRKRTLLVKDKVYRVTPVPRDDTIKTSGPCGADACSLGVNAGKSQSFGYQAGIKFGLGDVFQGEVKFTTTTGANKGWTYTCSYLRGHEPGMKILDTSRMRVYGALNYNDLFQATRCYTRGISESDYNKQLFPDAFDECPAEQALILGLQNGKLTLAQIAENTLREADSRVTSYATALHLFEFARMKYGESTWFGVPGKFMLPDQNSVRCSRGVTIATSPTVWRDGTDLLEWKFAHYTKRRTVF